MTTITPVDYQHGSIGFGSGGNQFDAKYTNSLPLAVGDVVIYASAAPATGAHFGYWVKFGGSAVILPGDPFTTDGGTTSVTCTKWSHSTTDMSMVIGFHTITSSNLDSVGNGSGTALTSFGMEYDQFVYGGVSFAAWVVRGSTIIGAAASAPVDTDPGPTIASPKTLAPAGLGTVGSDQLCVGLAALNDGGLNVAGTTTGNIITTSDNFAFTALSAASKHTDGLGGTVAAASRSFYAVTGDNTSGSSITFTGDQGTFGNVDTSSLASMVVAVADFTAVASSAIDAWAWVG